MTECPYCLGEIGEADEATACPACHASYHAECWTENGGCCVRDCAAAVHKIELDVPASENAQIAITSDAAEKAIPHVTRKQWNPCLRCGRHLPATELYCRECKPEREESQDSRNAGPILLILLLILLVSGWIYFIRLAGDDNQDKRPTQIQSGVRR